MNKKKNKIIIFKSSKSNHIYTFKKSKKNFNLNIKNIKKFDPFIKKHIIYNLKK